ncbi:MAG: hypothetical protein JXR03_01645 [Cyclobacteriaceae bacterium]
MSTKDNLNSNAWLGIVLVVVGGSYLIDNLGIFPNLPYWLFSWKSLFVVVGVAMLATGRSSGLVFLLIGGFFLFPDVFHFFNIPFFEIRQFWPVILIVIGISIILKRRSNFDFKSKDIIDDDYLHEVSIFGGSEKSISSKNFKGGRVSTIFSGTDIDLAAAELSDGDNVIDAFCFFGGISFVVPQDWTVVRDATTIFGAWSDDRRLSSQSTIDPNKVLRIKGFVMFGGGEIKSA